MTEPKVKVGILFEPEIEFVLLAPYRIDGCEISGAQTVTCRNGHIVWPDRMYDELRFEPADALSGSFEIRNVTIGINFHWERKEHQRFQGAFHLIVENDLCNFTQRLESFGSQNLPLVRTNTKHQAIDFLNRNRDSIGHFRMANNDVIVAVEL